MSKGQAVYCFGLSVSGAIAMVCFGAAFAKHYPYFGYEGDMDEAAGACFRTAIAFGILGGLSVVLFMYAAAKQRMAPTNVRGRYEAV
ncbi:hypothetical protein NDN08_003544 [Rhodosorus marinus]|uniref:Uncharacterized protein n=1 Tax=Rhodosorus marinus TaxID=101924 RepID=A0AAV8V2S3_9RHOD|nr:hypothetical protein NDN08_003544 [Rhodosorus marinus]